MLPVGFLVGTALIGFLTKKYRKESLLSFGIVMQGAIVVLIGAFAMPSVYVNMEVSAILIAMSCALFGVGVMNILVNVPFQVTLQETVPDSYRGRVFGLMDSMVQLLVPLSMALSGVLVDMFSVASLFWVPGVVITCLGFGLAASRNVRLLYVKQETA
jgi:predicted MFS family arabinose efflux permease